MLGGQRKSAYSLFGVSIATYKDDLQCVFDVLNNVISDKVFDASNIDRAAKLITVLLFSQKRKTYDNIKSVLALFLGMNGSKSTFKQIAYLLVGNKYLLSTRPVVPCRLQGACSDSSALVEFQHYDPTKSLMRVMVLSGPHAGDVLMTKMTRDRAIYLARRMGLITNRSRSEYFGINSLIDRIAVAEVVRTKDTCRIISLDGSRSLKKYNLV